MQCSMISSLFLFSGLISILIAAPLGDVVVAKVDDTKTDGQAMYSYSEAVVGENGKPSISQLTIARGKDGRLHYAKNQGGTIKTGIWEGPIPSAPDTQSLKESLSNITGSLADPLAVLNQSIGNTVQEYILQALKF